jgi:hypothetical protein
MTDYWEKTAPEIIRRLDEFMEAAYFVPLSIGDALAVQFKAPSLKGLTVDTIAGVWQWMDTLDILPDHQGGPDPVVAAQAFWQGLSENWPEVYAKWSQGDTQLHLDPLGAFQLVLWRSEEAISHWLAAGPDQVSSRQLEEFRNRGVAEIMAAFDYRWQPHDRALRQSLSSRELNPYPGWARPAIYLDCWAEFVRAVMDLDPGPAIRAVWPY